MSLQETLESLTASELKQRCARLPMSRRPTRKADMVEAIRGHLLSDALKAVVARLSEPERDAVAEAVHNWKGSFRPDAFKAKYGALPGWFTRDPYSWPKRHTKKTDETGVLEVIFYYGRVPEDLASRLAPLVPAPAPMQVETLDDDQLPEVVTAEFDDEPETLRRADTEFVVQQELPALLGLVGQGGAAVSAKTGLPSAAGVRRIEALLVGGDWYDHDDDQDLPRYAGGPIRPIRAFAWPLLLQVGGLAKIDGSKLALTAKGKKALSQPVHEVVSQLFDRWQIKGAPDELRRVDTIKGQTSKGVKLSSPLERRTVIGDALQECCPVGRWLSVDELFRQMKVLGHRFEVAGNEWKLYLVDAKYGSLGYSGSAGFEVLEGRYTLVYLFEYLATLGMIDVAYSLPYYARSDYNDNWGADELEFLSRYDGLRYLRLNELGAYCLGISDRYAPRLPERAALFRAEADLDLCLLRAAEPAERLQLEQIAEQRSPERWRLNPEALLARAADADERGRIRRFLESSHAGELPAELTELLDGVDARATAVTDVGAARLIHCRDAALAVLLSTDPATAGHCIRAGERQLCVPQKKLAAFRKGLAKLGFALPQVTP